MVVTESSVSLFHHLHRTGDKAMGKKFCGDVDPLTDLKFNLKQSIKNTSEAYQSVLLTSRGVWG